MKNQQPTLFQQGGEVRLPPPPAKFSTRNDPFRLVTKTLGLILCIVTLPEILPAGAGEFLVFQRQGRKAIPRIMIGQQAYLPVTDLLHVLDLPYSESASAGFVQIVAGKNRLKLTKGQSQAMLNETSIPLSAPVVVFNNQWLAPPDFVSRALGRVLSEKIAVAPSGNAFAVGETGFARLNVRLAEPAGTLSVQASTSIAAEIRHEGSRVVFAFGNAPVDLVGQDTVQKPDWIRSVDLDQTEAANQLVIELADKTLTAKVTHLASQNIYLVEASRQAGTEPKAGAFGELPRPMAEAWKWRHITVDAGHGGQDRGVAIRESLFEKDVALAIARKLRWALENRLGVSVVLSRPEDQLLRLEDRVAAANLARSNLFISIHTGNGAASPAAYSYAYTAQPSNDEGSSREPKSARSLFVPWGEAQRSSLVWSQRLAECLQAEMNRALNGGESLAFRRSPLKVLSALAMPAVLVEIGNARVSDFQAKAESDQFQNLVAATLVAAVEKFRALHERP